MDELRGVAENIIVGQPVALGTGAIDLVYKHVPIPEENIPKPPEPEEDEVDTEEGAWSLDALETDVPGETASTDTPENDETEEG